MQLLVEFPLGAGRIDPSAGYCDGSKEHEIKSTTFHLSNPSHYPEYMGSGPAQYRVGTLPAYAIEYADLWLPADIDGQGPVHEIVYPGKGIDGDTVYWAQPHHVFHSSPEVILVVHYHGIRRYPALFPTVSDDDRRMRLGEFYWEAEIAFDNGAWLSFMLMCGAIFEGILIESVRKKDGNFRKITEQAERRGIINAEQRELVTRVREMRNLVHLGKAGQGSIDRADALDARVVLDRIIRSVSEQIDEVEPDTG